MVLGPMMRSAGPVRAPAPRDCRRQRILCPPFERALRARSLCKVAEVAVLLPADAEALPWCRPHDAFRGTSTRPRSIGLQLAAHTSY